MKRKLKKFFSVLSVVLCLVSVNLSLFSVGVSANVVEAGDSSLRTLGVPVTLDYYFSKEDSDGFINPYFGYLSRPNCYLYNNGAPQWYQGFSDSDIFSIYYNQIGSNSGDVFIFFDEAVNVSTISIDRPLLFTSSSSLTNHYNFNIGIYLPKDAFGNVLNDFVVSYKYVFLNGSFGDDTFDLSYNTVQQSEQFFVRDSWAYFPLFNYDVLTENVISDNKNFVGTQFGERYCYLVSAQVDIIGLYSEQIYFEPMMLGANKLLSDYNRIQQNSLESIYDAQSYEEHIVFEDLSWTDWIVNSVGAFLDFEIIPGLSFAGMLGLLVGMSLFVVFLKIFAGG